MSKSTVIFFVLIAIIAGGMFVVASAMGATIPGAGAASGCYDMLNAAGQVVQTVCP